MVLRILAAIGAVAAAPSALGQASPGTAPPPSQAQPPPAAPQQPGATGTGTGAGAGQQGTPPSTATPTSPPPPAAPQGGTGSGQQQTPVVVEHERVTRPPLETVAVNAGYGALAGLLVGGGVALIEQDHVGRDLMVGTGVGVIVGALVGAVQVATAGGGDKPVRDGLGSVERSPPRPGVYTFGLFARRF